MLPKPTVLTSDRSAALGWEVGGKHWGGELGLGIGAPPPGNTCPSAHTIWNHKNKERKKTSQSSVTRVLIAPMCVRVHTVTQTHTSTQARVTGLYVNSRHTHAHGLMGLTNMHTCTHTPMLPSHALGRSPDLRVVLEREESERTS